MPQIQLMPALIIKTSAETVSNPFIFIKCPTHLRFRAFMFKAILLSHISCWVVGYCYDCWYSSLDVTRRSLIVVEHFLFQAHLLLLVVCLTLIID